MNPFQRGLDQIICQFLLVSDRGETVQISDLIRYNPKYYNSMLCGVLTLRFCGICGKLSSVAF